MDELVKEKLKKQLDEVHVPKEHKEAVRHAMHEEEMQVKEDRYFARTMWTRAAIAACLFLAIGLNWYISKGKDYLAVHFYPLQEETSQSGEMSADLMFGNTGEGAEHFQFVNGEPVSVPRGITYYLDEGTVLVSVSSDESIFPKGLTDKEASMVCDTKVWCAKKKETNTFYAGFHKDGTVYLLTGNGVQQKCFYQFIKSFLK